MLNHTSTVKRSIAWLAIALSAACPPMAQAAQAAQPDLNQMFQVMPLSAPTTTRAPEQATAPARTFTALSSDSIAAGATSIAQVLGSTASGTLIKAYTVTHMRASDVQTLLADPNSPLLPKELSTVVVDSRSNTLLVKGTEAEHQLIENLIRRLDVPAKQILVEVKIVSADEYFGKSLGAKFGVTSSHMLGAATPRQQGTQVGGTVGDLNQIANTGGSTFPNSVSLPATNSLTSALVSTFAFGFYKLPAGINIGLEISALEEAGHTKVLSNPKLVLSNLRPGLISSGQRIPYSKPSLVQGVSTTEFIDVKVSVAVTALVAPDGSISMDLSMTDDSVGGNSSVGPTINTNQATSNVTLQSGETLLLGGFQSSSQVEEKNKTPLLGDIPVVGHLFKNQSNNTVKRELLFIITPTIIESERM
jgi:type IV pilus assembly protein PilQ